MSEQSDYDDRALTRCHAINRRDTAAGTGLRPFAEVYDQACAELGIAAPAPVRRRTALRAVTAENSHEFTQPPKRRGRKPKVRTGGNVVLLRAGGATAPDNDRVKRWMRAMADVAQQQRNAARAARGMPPIDFYANSEGGRHD